MKKKLALLMILLMVVGSNISCSIKGLHIIPDYSIRKFAMLSFLHRVEEKYGIYWYDNLNAKEKKELKKINKMKPRLVIVEQVNLSGFGAESAQFKEHLGVEKNEAIDLPDIIPIPSTP